MDNSFLHLSQVGVISANTQLYSGGDYQTTGDRILTLPKDGNKFTLQILNGEVTFVGGTVNGQTDATIFGPGRRVFTKIADDWRQVSASSGTGSSNYTTVTASTTLSAEASKIWANSANNAIILALPVGLPADTTFFIRRRGGNLVTVDPGGTEGVINPDTGVSDQSGVTINEDDAAIELKKTGSNWELTVVYNP